MHHNPTRKRGPITTRRVSEERHQLALREQPNIPAASKRFVARLINGLQECLAINWTSGLADASGYDCRPTLVASKVRGGLLPSLRDYP